MAPVRRPENRGAGRTEPPEVSALRELPALPELEELDQRLEAAFPSSPDFHWSEPCVWACACFLVDGSRR